MDENEIERILLENPGDPLFLKYAEELMKSAKFEQALMVCLRGVSKSPAQLRGRLLLARAYYELGMMPLAAEQMKVVAQSAPESLPIQKLYNKLSVYLWQPGDHSAFSGPGEAVMAEAEFDIGDMDLLEEEKKSR
ncbi:MAG: hypothetical protein J5J00_00330 [Deltaproteobacteria bacterium]|nr:hypothetical protein [Deltaproteobacteria bacterium]